ncbi:DUF4368 domain-containing protein [Enterococcus sp. CWB-B31]|uniref:DUF4368 domain-containing protein n=1 Tax=Enterococcus sp. CWB-B31 TaxID=2885159 RepID=UPI001E2FC2A0|nr:DUF4368 domain-containing protein [Enterococcus sp. CWB-B31]MCB5955083.1 DUF4368 domain-containing protein [Enterococcus sp. CWB-B31]
MKASFEEKITHLKQVIRHIQAELEEQRNKRDIVAPYLNTFLEYKNVKQLNRAMLVELVEKISIHEDKNLTIEFKFGDIYEQIANK